MVAKSRTAAELVGGIAGRVGFLIEIGAGRGGQVAAGGESQHADAGGVDAPFLARDRTTRKARWASCSGRGVADGAFMGRHAVFQQHAGDADGIQPLADFGAFEIEGQDTVAAAGRDDDRCAGVLPGWRRKDLDGGIGDAADPRDAFAGDEGAFSVVVSFSLSGPGC